MVAIGDSIGGVENFEWVARTVQWAAINKDRFKRGHQINDGWWLLLVGLDQT